MLERPSTGTTHDTDVVRDGFILDFISGTKEVKDAYAEPTDRYGTFRDAFHCLLADTSFNVPTEPQGDLLGED